VRPAAGGTQLADQFRQSVQAGGSGAVVEEGPQDGWFVGVNGVPLGPIPVGDLRELASAGHIDRKSLVWREGQAEWRPLGKFPFLARVLDEGGAASTPPPAPPEPVESAPPTARNSAANGQIATGFDARPVEARAERPSAWGDLDEDDDEEEQPTTVKGRVSVAPPPQALVPGRVAAPGAPPLALPGLPPAPAPPALKVDAPLATGQGPASSTGAVSVPPSAADAVPNPVVSALPVGEDAEAKLLRGKGRKRMLVIALAAAAAVAVGAIAWHLLSAPPPKNAASPPAHTLAASTEQEKKPEPPPSPPPAEPAPGTPQATAESIPGEPPIAQIPEPPPTVKSPPAPPAPSAEPPAAKPTPSLLSGLNTLQTPGPAPGLKSPGAGASAGPGLEATAIQRTVRKYSPAVRQNCWQRALNARAPGVPSSAKVTATITVDASGRVQSVTASGAPRGYPGLAHCIEEAVKGWAFPRSLGETVTNVPFMFVGQ
jgi:hypothetical protein